MHPYKPSRFDFSFNPRIWGLGLTFGHTDMCGFGLGVVFGPFDACLTSKSC